MEGLKVPLVIGLDLLTLPTQPQLVIKPKTIIPHHWDGPMPHVGDGIDFPFEAIDFYAAAVDEAGAELLVPNQYFEQYLIKDGVLSRGEEAPIQEAFGLSPNPF